MRGIVISVFVIIVLVVLGGILWIMVSHTNGLVPSPTPTFETEPSGDNDSHSYKGMSFIRTEGFGLAVNADQVLVESNIPPCSEDFIYCLYYNGSEYENTNFESAGVGIFERMDLDNRESCLYATPLGFSYMTPEVKDNQSYGASLFTPIQVSGAGHSSTGEIYRLFAENTCFEFETRIGVTQLENYEPGTVVEFTEAQKDLLRAKINNIIGNIRLTATPEEPVLTY